MALTHFLLDAARTVETSERQLNERFSRLRDNDTTGRVRVKYQKIRNG